MVKRIRTKPAKNPVEVAEKDPPVLRDNTKAPNYFSVYMNDAQLQSSLWDFRLIIGNVVQLPSDSNPKMEVEQLGEIRMSPQLARRLTFLLMRQLQVYEQNFGRIPSPKE